MNDSNENPPSQKPISTSVLLVLTAFDLAVVELAQIKGVSYGEQRNQLLLQASLTHPDPPRSENDRLPN